MALNETDIKKRRLTQNEYAGMILAIAAPVIGIFFGLYLKYEGSEWGLRVVGIAIISAFIWAGFIFL